MEKDKNKQDKSSTPDKNQNQADNTKAQTQSDADKLKKKKNNIGSSDWGNPMDEDVDQTNHGSGI